MKFDVILHLRKKAEKDINRAMRAGGTLITLGRGLETEINGDKTEIH